MNEVTPPKRVRVLPGGIIQREPWASELAFFKGRTEVAGMAAEDNMVVLNPFSKLTAGELEAVALNEAARVVMRTHPHLRPEFEVSTEQRAAFASYGPIDSISETIAARLLSKDASALNPTKEQGDFVLRLATEMGLA